MGSKGRKFFNGSDFKIDPFHTADAEKTLSSSMGFAGKGKKKGSLGNSNNTDEVLRFRRSLEKGEIKPPHFTRPKELPGHLEFKGRPMDLPGKGNQVLDGPYPEKYYGTSWDVNVGKTVVNDGEFTEVAPSYVREGLTSQGQHFVYSEKLVRQMKERGWTIQQIQNLLDYGHRLEGGIDYRYVNKQLSEYKTYQGKTVKFIDPDGFAIDFNIDTHELIHVDKRFKAPDFKMR